MTTETGCLVGEETTHGTEAGTIGIVAGISVIFAESVEENYNEYYDPAVGQPMAGMYQGTKDVGGSLNFFASDFRFCYWGLGSETMDEIYLTNIVGSPTTSDTISNGGTFAASVDAVVSSPIFTISSITLGDLAISDTITFSPSGATGTLSACIHDISHSNDPVSLTVEEIYAESSMDESEKYLGLRCSDFAINSSRGEMITVDYNMTGISEYTDTLTPGTRTATTRSPFVWNTGDVSLDGDDYNNVCDTFSITVTRNPEARGGTSRTAHQVIAGNYIVEATFEMDLPSSSLRTLRRNGTQANIVITLTETANTNLVVFTLSNCYFVSDVREQARDAVTVRVTVTARTGTMTVRATDTIVDYTSA